MRHFQTAGAAGVVAANARHSRAALETAANIWRAPRALGQAVGYQVSCNSRLHFKELSRSYRTSMVRQGRGRRVIDPRRGAKEAKTPGPSLAQVLWTGRPACLERLRRVADGRRGTSGWCPRSNNSPHLTRRSAQKGCDDRAYLYSNFREIVT